MFLIASKSKRKSVNCRYSPVHACMQNENVNILPILNMNEFKKKSFNSFVNLFLAFHLVAYPTSLRIAMSCIDVYKRFLFHPLCIFIEATLNV